MIAYKGFSKGLRSVMGNGNKATCTFAPGITLEETASKTGNCGFHCCENPFECLSYYSLNSQNRFFKVEAEGNIDEDDCERIACTKITLLEELTPLALALEGMKYIIEHPKREAWQQSYGNVQVQADTAEAKTKDAIAIARGKNPAVKGPEGSILGIIREGKDFEIVDAKLFVQGKELADKWVGINSDRTIVEVRNEKEND